jgi:hypothetical protein
VSVFVLSFHLITSTMYLGTILQLAMPMSRMTIRKLGGDGKTAQNTLFDVFWGHWYVFWLFSFDYINTNYNFR